MDKKEIVILVRDINGKRTEMRFENQDALISSDLKNCSNEDEILIVLWDGKCIYNQLSSAYSILWEDIIAFFA